jgi:tol-pal system protein YbgF
LTRFVCGPYPPSVIRTSTAIALVTLASSCVHESVTRAELNELMASVRALRAENARLDGRVEKLEQQVVVGSTRRTTTAAAAMTTSSASAATARSTERADALPQLTVVKLKPQRAAAPKLATRVEVAEPPEGLVDELKGDNKPDETDQAFAEAQYEKGVDAIKTGNIEGGTAQLLQFVSDWPRHPRADNALLYVGVALMAQQDWAGAAQTFERVTVSYPAGDSVLEALLKVAECRVRLKQPAQAKATLERIVSNYPGTPAASQAQATLATLASNSKSAP